MIKKIVSHIRDVYQTNEFIPLHAPVFQGNEKKYLLDTIDSTFVSSVGKYVDDFECAIEGYTGVAKAVATVNGTAALHAALYLAGVQRDDLVITQALTFVATCNALFHMGAEPVFVDVSKVSLGLCPQALEEWLDENAEVDEAGCFHKVSGRRIKAVLPMHTFGHPVQLDELVTVCEKWRLVLVEDAAESLGSFYKGRHTGLFGQYSALSFNGNKVITSGGGGMIMCKSAKDGAHAKHVTTTAKVSHPYEFFHDEPGFNYRLPNLNAALGVAQMEALEAFLKQKRQLAESYQEFFDGSDYQFVREPDYARSNYWLNAVLCEDKQARDTLLKETNDAGVMTRPVWALMYRLPAFNHSMKGDMTNSEWLEGRVVNIPSSVLGAV